MTSEKDPNATAADDPFPETSEIDVSSFESRDASDADVQSVSDSAIRPPYVSSPSSWAQSGDALLPTADQMVGKQYSRYTLVRSLGAGGMAQVFEGVINGPGGFAKRVVIKMILPEYAALSDFKDMFVNEARIAALLSHPNIVQTFDFGEVNDRLYIAMEHIDGASLQQVFRGAAKSGIPLGPRMAISIGVAIARALEHVSRIVGVNGEPLDVVHRDITPGNILISRQGEIKLTDFGVVKSTLNVVGTVAGTVKGKYAYMSPEQVTGQEVDLRSDIFSLGIVLWEIVTQRRLFKYATMAETITAVSKASAPKVTGLAPGCPPELARIITKALAADRRQRYQTATELLVDLETFRDSRNWTVSGREIAALLETVYPAGQAVRADFGSASASRKHDLENSVPGVERPTRAALSWPLLVGAVGLLLLIVTVLWLTVLD